VEHAERIATGARDESTSGAEPEESKKARVDRELREFLEETRVVLPGLELLFGFLLILPFTERFASIDEVQRTVYLASMFGTVAATALLLAPSARHRLGFRKIDKEQLLFIANRYLIGGLVLVAISLALSVYLAASLVIASQSAALLAGGIALGFVLLWFVYPLVKPC
jgi:hypothetical protein